MVYLGITKAELFEEFERLSEFLDKETLICNMFHFLSVDELSELIEFIKQENDL